MTDYNWNVFNNAELARLIRNGGLVAGFDTDFNRALVEETARRLEAAEARAAELEAERDNERKQRDDIAFACDIAQNERDTLRAQLAAEEAAHKTDVAALRERINKIIQTRIDEIRSDERYSYPAANVSINAPLALIQVDMEARVSELESLIKRIQS